MKVCASHGGGRKLLFHPKENGFARELQLSEFDENAQPTRNVMDVTPGRTGITIDQRAAEIMSLRPISRDRAALLSGDARMYSAILQEPAPKDEPKEETLAAFADALLDQSDPPAMSGIPAAYTYLGQFIAHDISRTEIRADGNTLMLLPGALRFDSLFGRGDSVGTKTPGVIGAFDKSALGPTKPSAGFGPSLADLPRKKDGRPRIPEARNDFEPEPCTASRPFHPLCPSGARGASFRGQDDE